MFLARSGIVTPLEVEVDITDSPFDPEADGFDSDLQAQLVRETLEFVVSHGGIPSRWTRLVVWFEASSAMFAAIDFLTNSTLDNLRKLSLIDTFVDQQLAEDLATEAVRGRDLSKSIMFNEIPPVLHELELIGIPSNFFFAHNETPLAFNLTHLHLGCLISLPPLMSLRVLLHNSPQLEALCLDMSMIDMANFHPEHPAAIRVSLPFLRRFSLQEPISVTWGLAVLQMIDAPGLEAFSLNLDQSQTFIDPIPMYIAYGRVNHQLVDQFPTPLHEAIPSPIYPALKHFALGPYSGSTISLGALLGAFKHITRLDWELEDNRYMPIDILARHKSHPLCPRLEHLRVFGVPDKALVNLVDTRINQGIPLKVVEVNSREWDKMSNDTKIYLTGVLEKFGQYVDDKESDIDSDSDDSNWVDTDSSTGVPSHGGSTGSTVSTSSEDENPHPPSDESVSSSDSSETEAD